MNYMKSKKKQKPIVFLQDTGIYSNEIVLSFGASKEEILKYLKSHKIKKEAIEWIEKDENLFKIFSENNACLAFDRGRMIGLFKHFEDTWEFWETLIHELHHAVNYLTENKRMEKEVEAQAYLQEYLFRSIRRKLQKTDPL